ncbi:MAG: 1-deoxy-D-xylulose-5-phosphate reductoisomerase [Ruminococcaceae bacterium]|nr:1-deoxy-D-xylulose-5-phosphate reductoisomerase [Oscillospiraceae bacterium]
MRSLVILGSTGSIGTQALEVAQQAGYRIVGLAAARQVELLEQQIRQFGPSVVAMYDEKAAADLQVRVADLPVKVLSGMAGLCALAAHPEADMVLNSVVGMVGLRPTLAAIAAGHDVALANKETLVAGGAFVMEAVKKAGVKLLPVDSEHSAIFQCLQGCPPEKRINRLILTASGGPFFGRKAEELEQVTLADALNHPNWSMGQKITIDSATMMNKGLELIEASWLFDMPPEKIDIVVHRESIIHSLVEYDDNAVLAQLGTPDMRVPIQYALTYPDRLPCPAKQLRLEEWSKLTFFAPDNEAFPAMNLARKALTMGGLYPAALNAANEVAVGAFIAGEIGFADITRLAAAALDLYLPQPTSVEEVFTADETVRAHTRRAIDAMK